MKRLLLSALALITATLAPATSSADTFAATLGEPMYEVSHAVSLTLERGIGRYVVRRTFSNTGDRHDEAVLSIELPAGAAATGLRIRVGEKWYDGELMDADRAERLYRELTGLGPHTPRDPALLSWEWADRLQLRVFPVPPGGTATVEYTLTLPTEYHDGSYVLTYPLSEPSAGLADPVLTVLDWSKGPIVVGRGPVASDQPIVLAATPPDTRCEAYGMSARCVVGEIDVAHPVDSGPVMLNLNIRHTYQADLSVVLVSPSGQRFDVWDHEGDGDNDVRLEKRLLAAATPAGAWGLAVVDDAELDVGVVESWSLTFVGRGTVRNDRPVHVPDHGGDGSVATIALHAPDMARAMGRLGAVSMKGASVGRLELDMPPRLSEMPRQPLVTFVVDVSKSIDEDGLADQKMLIESFLAHVPDARFEVVAYSRFAQRLNGAFLPAHEFAGAWKQGELSGMWDLSNGSNTDSALVLAYETLGKEKGPRYVIAFTDDRLRPSWPEQLPLSTSTKDSLITHVVVLDSVRSEMRRDDAHRLAPIALQDGGILSLVGAVDAIDPKALGTSTLNLVRPTRVDFFTIDAFEDLPDVMYEGTALREMAMRAVPREVKVRGKLWAQPYGFTIKSRRVFDRATAAWIFSHDLHDELSPEQMLAFAKFGRAVSPVTSYLAIEPGVRPSTIGLERRGAGGLGMRGSGRGGGGFSRTARQSPSLKGLLAPLAKACHGEHGPESAKLDLHTTQIELVDVELRSTSTPYARCLEEAAWRLDLPSDYARYESLSETVVL